ncbi:DUF992 domain-containing protein [Xanthobacter agilis]|jgi:hypothetical protein|uniref:DUF992 domain-containing protein n=1 Tax=Xanthobacter agilis TaxID=47492 RepID=A0ABU0LCH1_XANAG|nr:DUF992 domain-containing protein [Xanthobacter agilis]MDQ0504830.1 hypothetical protein [Xanthobacter agilis]
MKTVFKAGLAAAALCALSALPASAQSRVQVGELRCTLAPNVSFILGSVRDMSCTFKPRKGKTRTYEGTIRRLGLDIGVSGQSILVWGVFAPSSSVSPETLRGSYVGASANAAVGAGLGANALVGGNNNTIALQPLSVEAQTGLNVGLTVSDMSLR